MTPRTTLVFAAILAACSGDRDGGSGALDGSPVSIEFPSNPQQPVSSQDSGVPDVHDASIDVQASVPSAGGNPASGGTGVAAGGSGLVAAGGAPPTGGTGGDGGPPSGGSGGTLLTGGSGGLTGGTGGQSPSNPCSSAPSDRCGGAAAYYCPDGTTSIRPSGQRCTYSRNDYPNGALWCCVAGDPGPIECYPPLRPCPACAPGINHYCCPADALTGQVPSPQLCGCGHTSQCYVTW